MAKQGLILLFLFFSIQLLAQEKDSLSIVSVDSVAVKKNLKKLARIKRRKIRQQKNIRPYNALAPSKAAFYSAVLPGLGQAYTGKYWKIPIVYGALGTGIGITLWNKNNHDEIRDIFKNRLRGITTDRFYDQENDRAILSNNGLIEAQRQFRKQQELSILITVGLYVLNIVDANVTAHLQQYNLNKKLSFSPKIEFDTPTAQANYGMVLQYSF